MVTTPPPITRSGAQRDARHELAKPVYHHSGEPLLVRALRAVGRRLDDIITTSARHSPGGGAGLIALVLVAALVIGALAWRTGPLRRTAAAPGVLAPGRVQRAAEHRRQAEQAERAGDWRTAVLERMRALARELEQRGVLDPRAGRTALELAAEAGRALPDLAEPLAQAARSFDDVVYGGRTATAAMAATVRDADVALARIRSTVRAEAEVGTR